MNYFELFGIPVQLKLDVSTLHNRYVSLSRQHHPDYFVNDTPGAQAEALEKSAMLNQAYKVFKSQDETIGYVLKEKGLLVEEEKYDLPPAFLMRVMELNEQLMEAYDDEGLNRMQIEVDNLQHEIYEPVKEIVEHYQEGVTSEKELLQVKQYYFQKKYLDRIRHQLGRKV
ncbi:MAG: hypothetical protein H7Y42_19440 [Chitinophagaceae bacterium]|nr:hypothetical protein [Chitinophagaceae bacterium]